MSQTEAICLDLLSEALDLGISADWLQKMVRGQVNDWFLAVSLKGSYLFYSYFFFGRFFFSCLVWGKNGKKGAPFFMVIYGKFRVFGKCFSERSKEYGVESLPLKTR